MSAVEFEAWPKIPRLNRDIVITEKIDGTNAAVLIAHIDEVDHIDRDGELYLFDNDHRNLIAWVGDHAVFAQSRSRFITPEQDNYGLARWVKENAQGLVEILGPGRHFGEWWGSGIQRGYGLTKGEKRFSLFNTGRWWNEFDHGDLYLREALPGLGTVPVLYRGPFDQNVIKESIENLRDFGSVAAPGFDRPEGVIVYHEALRSSFKVTLVGDEAPKSVFEKEEKVAA